ncbi:lysine transporter LysE [Amylibacter kogurei]|uniref:Lysine transporter LysE n=2 Tax=Paramylibacter kogurei TaxID=1889778 RepID=A0A2G5KBG9_9RHOB|nr:lysine transporter LysE [Amylibacter kogurei]
MFQTVVALFVFLFPLAYSPGPGNMFFAANGARFGFRATIPANIGYHVATWIVTLFIGLGFARAVNSQPQVFAVLKVAGSVYVFWLAWKLFRSGALTGQEVAKPASFFDGVVLLILNPKAYVIIVLMFTQFLDHGDPRWLVGVIATVFTINNLIAFVVWTMIGDQIAARFRTPATARKLNMVFGIILAVVAVWMLLS